MSEPRPVLDAGRILGELVDGGVDFVVIGGIAAVLHGSARNTFDLDISFSTGAANLEALGSVLIALKARLRGVADDVPFVPEARALRQIEALTLSTVAGDFDLLAKPAGGPPYDVLRDAADTYDLDGTAVRVATVEHLIAMKSAAGRDKDLADIAELQAILRLRG